MSRPDHTKTDTEKAREEELIQRLVLKIHTYMKNILKIYYCIYHLNRLVEVVGRRNEIVENLEKDRLREAEEDRSVFNQIGTFAQGSKNIHHIIC